MQLCGSLSILWHFLSLGLEWKLTFSSPVATAEFSKAWYKFWSNQYLPSTHFWSSALCQRPLTDAGHSLGEDTDHVNIIQIKQAGWSTEGFWERASLQRWVRFYYKWWRRRDTETLTSILTQHGSGVGGGIILVSASQEKKTAESEDWWGANPIADNPRGSLSQPWLQLELTVETLKIQMLRPCCCYYSVAQSCLTLCDPVDCSMPGFPVLYHLPELPQTHVHWIIDAIQLSHPLSSCLQSFPESGSFLMSWFIASHGWSIGASASASALPIPIQSFQFRVD